jgi:hypothetical protein
VIAHAAREAERADRCGGVGEQRPLEVGISPRLGDRAGAVVGADPGLIGLDDEIERGRIHVALLGQDRLQGPHPQLHLGQVGAMLAMRAMMMVTVMIAVTMIVMILMIVLVLRHDASPAKSSRHYPSAPRASRGLPGRVIPLDLVPLPGARLHQA